MNVKSLESIGLTRNESFVYLALLQLGTAKTGDILRTSKLNSGRIYETLESLKAKGLVSESIINKVRHFTAAPTIQLRDYLEQKKVALKEESDNIEMLIPELEKLRIATKSEIKAVTYLGFRGIKTAIEEATDQLKPGDEILGMGIRSNKDEHFNRFTRNWINSFAQRKLTARMIFSDAGEHFQKSKNVMNTKSRVFEGMTPAAIDVMGDSMVLIFNFTKDPSCVLIYDTGTARSFRTFFEQMWNLARE